MRRMKFQFSLATLLAVTSALAIDCAVCALIRVPEITVTETIPGIKNMPASDEIMTSTTGEHAPNLAELSGRVEWSAPLALAATLGVMWAIRRTKSRRHTEPLVG